MSREKSLFQRAKDSQESDRDNRDRAAAIDDKIIYERSIEGNDSDMKQNKIFSSMVVDKEHSKGAVSSNSHSSA